MIRIRRRAWFGLLLAGAAGAWLPAEEESQGEGEGGGSSGQSELEFVDLRLGGGYHAGRLDGSDLTLMAGNIGDKTPHNVSTLSDAGILVGLRGMWDVDNFHIPDAPTFKTRLAGLELVGGVGFFLGVGDDLELLAGYGRGETSDATKSGIKKDGSFSEIMGEIGYYHVIGGPVVLGLNLGYSYDKITLNGPQGGSFAGKCTGIDLKAVLGWRF